MCSDEGEILIALQRVKERRGREDVLELGLWWGLEKTDHGRGRREMGEWGFLAEEAR